MSLVTLFSAPKSFMDARIATIQSNALSSWARLADTEVLLLGEEEGIGEAAARVGARHLAAVNESAARQ